MYSVHSTISMYIILLSLSLVKNDKFPDTSFLYHGYISMSISYYHNHKNFHLQTAVPKETKVKVDIIM